MIVFFFSNEADNPKLLSLNSLDLTSLFNVDALNLLKQYSHVIRCKFLKRELTN